MTILEETYWEKGNRTKMGIYVTDVEMDFLLSSLDISKHNDVLDIGAGAGRFSIPLSRKGLHVNSLDLDLHSLKRLKFNYSQSNVVQSDARAVPLKENIVDLVVSVECVDYVPELALFIGEVARILKSEGKFIFTFGNKSSFKGKLKSWRGSSYCHSYGEVLTSLSKAGFVVLKQTGFNWLPFNRTSNNHWVFFMTKVEKFLGLRRFVRYSPWVMIYVAKLR